MKIEGLAAIVTGGASGLGEATAARLVVEGAKVTIFDVDEIRGPDVASAIGANFLSVDVSDEAAVASAVLAAASASGVPRILVNCAGLGPPANVIGHDGIPGTLVDFAKTVAVNLIGTFAVLTHFAALLHREEPIGEERGVIINTASIAAFDGQIGQAASAAAKAGTVGMTLPIARELARHAIRVMTIAPGFFRTPLISSLPQAVQNRFSAQVPFPSRLGHPDEFAQLVVNIVDNSMLNGETIRLDGAIRMPPY